MNAAAVVSGIEVDLMGSPLDSAAMVAGALPWNEYAVKVSSQLKSLLETRADDESAFQDFFERHPSILPHDAMGRRHDAWPEAVITQPQLRNFVGHTPDFLLIEEDSGGFMPVLVEIEAPAKPWSNGQGNPSAKLTQALGQLADWQSWLADTNHQDDFRDYYDLHIFDRREFSPLYRLVYGRRADAQSDERFSAKRKLMRTRDQDVMSYDRLTPMKDFANTVTVRRVESWRQGDPKFELVGIPACFVFNRNAGELCMRVRLNEDAVRGSEWMMPERAQHIIDSWPLIGDEHRKSKTGQHYSYTAGETNLTKLLEER